MTVGARGMHDGVVASRWIGCDIDVPSVSAGLIKPGTPVTVRSAILTPKPNHCELTTVSSITFRLARWACEPVHQSSLGARKEDACELAAHRFLIRVHGCAWVELEKLC